MDPLLKQWNETYFAGQLSSEVLNILDELALSSQPNSVQGFIERYFKFMQQTYVPAIDFPDELARSMHVIPHFMSNTWVNTPPPITYAGRHTDIDDYVSCNQWRPLSPQGQFLDLGCGFPPRTTLDTADRLPAWQVIGADPIIPAYIVYDEHDNHATFDQTGNLLYLQAQNEQLSTIYRKDPPAAREYFNQLFQTLSGQDKRLDANGLKPSAASGARLVRNPIAEYAKQNLSFQTAGIGDATVQGADIIRCLNVLMYYDHAFRNEALAWFRDILNEGGLLVCGKNYFHHSLATRYSVYQKVQGELLAREFAFSLDNLRSPMMAAWFTLQADEFEALMQAAVIECIRADTTFRRDFDVRLDALLVEYGLFRRDAAGYLTSDGQRMANQQEAHMAQIMEQLDQEGYVEGAVKVLKRAGYTAWRTCVGHISVDPNQFALFSE